MSDTGGWLQGWHGVLLREAVTEAPRVNCSACQGTSPCSQPKSGRLPAAQRPSQRLCPDEPQVANLGVTTSLV